MPACWQDCVILGSHKSLLHIRLQAFTENMFADNFAE